MRIEHQKWMVFHHYLNWNLTTEESDVKKRLKRNKDEMGVILVSDSRLYWKEPLIAGQESLSVGRKDVSAKVPDPNHNQLSKLDLTKELSTRQNIRRIKLQSLGRTIGPDCQALAHIWTEQVIRMVRWQKKSLFHSSINEIAVEQTTGEMNFYMAKTMAGDDFGFYPHKALLSSELHGDGLLSKAEEGLVTSWVDAYFKAKKR
uniref:SCP domain-containing protein n=1 Tax=Rhabditophanes sp. KR3021 TaxID=114890 RepID=A0AC35TQZ8_9BILA